MCSRWYTRHMNTFLITDLSKDSSKKEIINLYKTAFPRNERFPVYKIKKWIKNGIAIFNKYYDNNKLIGFTLCLKDKNVLYLFYFAIMKSERSKGYGTKVLTLLKEEYKDMNIFLASEHVDKNTPIDDIKYHRQEFYKRNGFIKTDIIVREYGVSYDLFSLQKELKYEDYKNVMWPILTAIQKKLFFKQVSMEK